MRILYCDPDTKALTVTDVTNTKFVADEGLLAFFGDEDICVRVGRRESDDLNRKLFTEGRLDLTGYTCDFYDWSDDEDDEDDEFDFLLEPDFLDKL